MPEARQIGLHDVLSLRLLAVRLGELLGVEHKTTPWTAEAWGSCKGRAGWAGELGKASKPGPESRASTWPIAR